MRDAGVLEVIAGADRVAHRDLDLGRLRILDEHDAQPVGSVVDEIARPRLAWRGGAGGGVGASAHAPSRTQVSIAGPTLLRPSSTPIMLR